MQGLTNKECTGRCANGRYSTGGASYESCEGKCKAGSWSNVLTTNASGAGKGCTPCRPDHYGDEDGATMATCSGECAGVAAGSTTCHLHVKTPNKPSPAPSPDQATLAPSPNPEGDTLPRASGASILNMVLIPLSLFMAMSMFAMLFYLYKKEHASPGARTAPAQDMPSVGRSRGSKDIDDEGDQGKNEEDDEAGDKADETKAASAVKPSDPKKRKKKRRMKKPAVYVFWCHGEL